MSYPTTREAFEMLLNDKERCIKAGISEAYRRASKHRLHKGILLVDTMQQLLYKAGYRLKTQATWVETTGIQTERKS